METNILFAIQSLRSPFCDLLFRGFTYLGDGGIFWIVVSVIFLTKKETRYVGLTMLIAAAISGAVAQLLCKPLFNRTRPYIVYKQPILIPPPRGTSFPSGHTAVAFAVAWTYFVLYRNRKRWVFLAVAAGIAFSRMYLFVHYPSDVAVGIGVGIAMSYAARGLMDRLLAHHPASWTWLDGVARPAPAIPEGAVAKD